MSVNESGRISINGTLLDFSSMPLEEVVLAYQRVSARATRDPASLLTPTLSDVDFLCRMLRAAEARG